MLNHNLDLDTPATVKSSHRGALRPETTRPKGRFTLGQLLAPLNPAISAWHRRPHPGGSRVIIRFKNGYGAIISAYPWPPGTYEVAPLRFEGPDPDDYEFYFRSHVPDLTWCGEIAEIVGVCEQISRLLPCSGE
jgi:hypothetical protein